MKKEANSGASGIKIKHLSLLCIVISLCLMVVILISITRVEHSYQRLVEHTTDCIDGQKCAVSLERSSDFLTDQARLFVISQDTERMYLYFEEIDGKNRENMVAQLDELYGDTEPNAVQELTDALNESHDLEEVEVHAMCLISRANRLPTEDLPLRVAEWELTPEEKAMSKEELIEEARRLVFSIDYIHAKQIIKQNIQSTLNVLTERMEVRQNDSEDELQQVFIEQKFFIIMMMVLVCGSFLVVGTLIVYPVSQHVRSIQEDKKWKHLGVYEMQYLSHIYNQLYDKNEAYRNELEYKADHDTLTGIYNRAAFERMKKDLEVRNIPTALMLADVDCFKKVNDTMGHEIGDAALKKAASQLKELQLKNIYCLARIGGDEFAVLFRDVTQADFPAIESEIRKLNDTLGKADGVLPQLSISAGIAFSEKGYSNRLFRHADRALYYTKEHGRRGCTMYDPTLDTQA